MSVAADSEISPKPDPKPIGMMKSSSKLGKGLKI